MNTSKQVNEQISALADGELDAAQHEQLLRALREPAAREAWDTYHLIGDTLRSSDSAVTLSDGFADRMAARLAAEPSFLGQPASVSTAACATAPLNPLCTDLPVERRTAGGRMRRLAAPGMAVAATVLLAVTIGPRLHGTPANDLASAKAPSAAIAVITRDDQAVLRNPQIDEYLVAHQRFSPSLYSTAQYARPSTFATGTEQ